MNTAVSEMDKVVQQNASDSEETASAAQELSSQADELDKMVQELSAIVSGKTFKSNGMKVPEQKPAPKGTQQIGQTRKTQDRRQISQQHRQKQAERYAHSQTRSHQNSNRSRSAEKLIPLDDGDFKDF